MGSRVRVRLRLRIVGGVGGVVVVVCHVQAVVWNPFC